MKTLNYVKHPKTGQFVEQKSYKGYLIFSAVLVVAWLTASFTVWSKPQIYIAKADEATSSVQIIDRSPEKIAKLKAETVALISGCEVPNFKQGDAPIILDTNNKMSIGPLMFQIATVVEYEKKLYGRTVTRYEATMIALDADQAKQLATDIIFKDGGAGNWFNCSKKLDINQRVKMIKEFES